MIRSVVYWLIGSGLLLAPTEFLMGLPQQPQASPSTPSVRRWVPVASSVDSALVITGSHWNGMVGDLESVDGATWDVQADAGVVAVVLRGTCPTATPTRMEFDLGFELQAGSGNVIQTVEWYDYSQGTYVVLHTRTVASGLPLRTRVVRSFGTDAYVHPVTRQIEARVTFSWTGPQQPVVQLDRAGWDTFLPWTGSYLDFRRIDISTLNSDDHWIRTVFDLDASRMTPSPKGVRLRFDVTDPGPYDYTFRAELRETNNTAFPADGTSQVYRMRFDVEDLPDLHGPVTIFQRFNRLIDGPDLEVELTGASQFSDAVPNDLQVVAFNQRLRLGKFLKQKNDLLIVIYNAQAGKYRVSLNGETLHERIAVDTRASTLGSWTQFGLYPHGLHDAQNRANQIASGATGASFEVSSYLKLSFGGEVDLNHFKTLDRN